MSDENKIGYSKVVVGLQYGDEGKARVIDDLAEGHDVIARFNGGANAGHTLEVNGVKLALQQVPSGVFYEGKMLYIGSGCIVNITKLFREIEDLKKLNIDVSARLKISSQAGIIQPHHIILDEVIGGKVGTTRNGIGPAYADRAFRMWGDSLRNIRIGDLIYDLETQLKKMQTNYDYIVKTFNLEKSYSIDEALSDIRTSFNEISHFVEANPLFLENLVRTQGANVLFEGAQAFMLDVNKGTVPYVTSSGTSSAAAYTGGDLPPNYHKGTIGVAKAIMSRVGHGPFVSEFGGSKSEEYCMSFNEDRSPKYSKTLELSYSVEALLNSDDQFEMGKAVRILSGEYGTVTKRPRRVGAIDLVQLKYAIKANGVDELILTKCDLLNIFKRTKIGKLPVVTGYKINGENIDFVPASSEILKKIEPIVEYREIFSEDISQIKEYKDLPIELKTLISEFEEILECRISGLGIGPSREQFIRR